MNASMLAVVFSRARCGRTKGAVPNTLACTEGGLFVVSSTETWRWIPVCATSLLVLYGGVVWPTSWMPLHRWTVSAYGLSTLSIRLYRGVLIRLDQLYAPPM